MTVSELIEKLKELPQNSPVGVLGGTIEGGGVYVNVTEPIFSERKLNVKYGDAQSVVIFGGH